MVLRQISFGKLLTHLGTRYAALADALKDPDADWRPALRTLSQDPVYRSLSKLRPTVRECKTLQDLREHLTAVDIAARQRCVSYRDTREQVQAQRAAFRAAGGGGDPRDEFRSLFAGAKLDQERAKKMVDDKTAALQAGSPEVIAAAADFYDNLNPAQQQKVRDFMDRARRWRRG